MKYTFCLIIAICSFSTMSFAQPDSEKIETFKIGIFTQQIDLTSEESKVFWPLYNAYEAEKKAIKKQYNSKRQFRQLDEMTDEEAEQMILKHFEGQEKEFALTRTYFEKFKAVLPIKKVAKIYKAERVFKQRLVREMRKRRQENRD